MHDSCPPIVLFCDFGLPYSGQMKSKLSVQAPNVPVIDLFHDVPAYDICAGSALLAAHTKDFPPNTVFLCVVDPGVGSDQRKPGAVFAGGWWFVGPLNGLFEHVLRQNPTNAKAFEITTIANNVSSTFHGRDIFAPIAAQIAKGDLSALKPMPTLDIRHDGFDDDVSKVIYIDTFGNLMTGIQSKALQSDETIEILNYKLSKTQTFSDADRGSLFVYENAVGLLEIAANCANAKEILQITEFPPVKILKM